MKFKRTLAAASALLIVAGYAPVMPFSDYLPDMYITASASTYEGNPYAALVKTTTTVTFNGKPWYIIADNSTAVDAGTVTLLAADTSFGRSKFADSSNDYSASTVNVVLIIMNE